MVVEIVVSPFSGSSAINVSVEMSPTFVPKNVKLGEQSQWPSEWQLVCLL